MTKNILEVFPRRVRTYALHKHCSVLFSGANHLRLSLCFKVRRWTNKAKELSVLGGMILIR